MKKTYPYLNNYRFLQSLINNINTTYFVQVNILDQKQNLVKEIVGKVISANITINGNSAVRRAGSISFQIEENDQDISKLLILNKKIYLQIGYQNLTNEYTNFPILWFPLGVYIITGVSLNHNLSNTNASLTLKDKMCLLNGECGGILPAATVFDNYQVLNGENEYEIIHPTIYQIITELVNHFGGEQLGKIIISDLDTRIKQAMEWTGGSPLFVLKSGSNNGFYITANEADAVSKIQSGHFINQTGSPFETGSNIGFILTDFIYPGDLIGNAGDTVVSILDKIKNTLGNFEYFYDVYGNFHFQEIKNYLNNAQSKYILESLQQQQFIPDYLSSSGQAYLLQRANGKAVFSFKNNNNLITSYSNTPQLQNIKNDFIVWGLKKTTSGDNRPVRYHLAIDKKPQVGNTYEVIKYIDLYDQTMEKWYKPIKYNSKSLFPEKGSQGVIYYDNSTNKAYIWKIKDSLSTYVQIEATLQRIQTKDWRTQLYFQGIAAQPNGIDSNFYYAELMAEWPKIYDIQNGEFRTEAIKHSESVEYYLDFINPVSNNLRQISIDNIGRRSVVLNQNNINCVFEPYIPDVILIKIDYSQQGSDTDMKRLRDECEEKGLAYSQVNEDIYNYLTPSLGFNSGYEEIRQALYQYISYNETITLQTVPIYFLEPNTCIDVQDKDSFIQGNYMINSLSFSLNNSSSLSITANKLLQRL